MALIQAFSSLVCAILTILLSLVLCFVIKIYSGITVENQLPRVERDQPRQPVAYGSHDRRCITTRIDDENQNYNIMIQGNRQVPREQDERQDY